MDNLNTSGIGSTERESKGPVVGIVVIIILLVLGGVYLWQSKSAELPVDTDSTVEDPATADLSTQGNSTDLGDIEADVEATNLNNLDQELGQIESELNTNTQ